MPNEELLSIANEYAGYALNKDWKLEDRLVFAQLSSTASLLILAKKAQEDTDHAD